MHPHVAIHPWILLTDTLKPLVAPQHVDVCLCNSLACFRYFRSVKVVRHKLMVELVLLVTHFESDACTWPSHGGLQR